MALPLLFGFMAGYFHKVRKRKESILKRIAHIVDAEGGKFLLYLFFAGAVSIGIICSLSRSGILFALVSCFLFFVLYTRLQKHFSRGFLVFALVFIVSGIVAAITWEPLAARFMKMSEEFTADRARLILYKDTFGIFLKYPLTGTGAGTFIEVFPIYKSFITNDVYRYAHNDYLQLLAEVGIVGLLFLIAMLHAFFTRLFDIFSRKPSRVMLIQIGIACSLISFGLHSMTEFGAQIPAVLVTAIALSTSFWRTPIVQEKED